MNPRPPCLCDNGTGKETETARQGSKSNRDAQTNPQTVTHTKKRSNATYLSKQSWSSRKEGCGNAGSVIHTHTSCSVDVHLKFATVKALFGLLHG